MTTVPDNQKGSAPMPTIDKHGIGVNVHVQGANVEVVDLIGDSGRDTVSARLPLAGGGNVSLLGTLANVGAFADELASQVALISKARGEGEIRQCMCCGDGDASPGRTMCAPCLDAGCLPSRHCDRAMEVAS